MSLTPRQLAYGRILAVFYGLATTYHLGVLATASDLGGVAQIWTAGVAVAEAMATAGLWLGKRWGAVAFLGVASVQLLIHGTTVAFEGVGSHLFAVAVIVFHVVTITGFIAMRRHTVGLLDA